MSKRRLGTVVFIILGVILPVAYQDSGGRVDHTQLASLGAAAAKALDRGSSIATAAGLAGGIACFSVTLAGDDPADMVSVSNEIQFDSGVLSVTSCTINPALGQGTPAGKQLIVTPLAPGTVRITVDGSAAAIPNGTLYSCALAVASDAPLGPLVIQATSQGHNHDGVAVPLADAGGTISITNCGGDCEGDRFVTIGEVVRALNLFAGNPFCDPATPSRSCPSSDTSLDGQVAIGEVVQSLNRFSNGCPTTSPAPSTPTAETTSSHTPTSPPSSTPTSTATPLPQFSDSCGDDVINDPAEQCDGVADTACPGECQANCVCAGLPPNPEGVAPALDRGLATNLFGATEFLYAGPFPIQTGVEQGTIEPRRAAVLRGRVLDRSDQPLAGVTASVHRHPAYGQTTTRPDGMFDLAVNGGGFLTVNYAKDGYLPAQRQVHVPWQDFALIEDVVLIPLDPQVTEVEIDSAEPFQIAQGSMMADEDGVRQATILFPQGSTATMTLPDGTIQPLTTLHVRATEYTVGDNGSQAMPGQLPPTSGYTYAVELSVDEALAAGASQVTFNQPLPVYIDNFIGFPTGIAVPLAYYDRVRNAWIPIEDGRVIEIVDVVGGVAEVDTIGNGQADNGLAIGMTLAERTYLGSSYPPGKSLSRIVVEHFTAYDLNYGTVPEAGAEAPQLKIAEEETPDDPCEARGSIVECESQTLGERIPLVGTGLSLNYRTDRVGGREASKTLTIPLSGETIPLALKEIRVEISIAGRTFADRFDPGTNLSHTFEWDGRDAYGRTALGSQPAQIRVGYVYDGFYALPPYLARSFGAASGERIPGDIPARGGAVLWQTQTTNLGDPPDFRHAGIGGWSLDEHHLYDPQGMVLYRGDGSRRSEQGLNLDVITTIAGTGEFGFSGDGGPATEAQLNLDSGIAVTPDGSVLVCDSNNHRLRKIGPDGVINTIAGTGEAGFSGDGGPAISAQMNYPLGVAVAPDGSVAIADWGNNRVRQINPDGFITTIAGTGDWGSTGDGNLATAASLIPISIAITGDGSILIGDTTSQSFPGFARVRRVAPSGVISTLAGTGERGFDGDAGPGIFAQIFWPAALAAAGSSVLIADARPIRRIGPDGIIASIAGIGPSFNDGDGGPATDAWFFGVTGVTAFDSSVLISTSHPDRVRRVGPDGVITTLAGTDERGFNGDRRPAVGARLDGPTSIVVAPDGSILVVDAGNSRIRAIRPILPRFGLGDIAIASEDGRLLYRFNAHGRHLSTFDTSTGAIVHTFTYDAAGHVTSILDVDGNLTAIERNAEGVPTAIIAPFGQRTELTLDANGYLASVTNPAGDSYTISHTAEGLLTAFTDPNGNTSHYAYDALGRLESNTNASKQAQTLTRTETENRHVVQRTTPLGRSTTYAIERLSTGHLRRTVTGPDGTETVSLSRTDGTTTVTMADGTISETRAGPDPRFGMQASLVDTTISAGGLVATSSTVASTEPENLVNPLEFTSVTRTAMVNGRSTTATYDAGSRRTTTISAAGREAYVELDDKGRVTERGVAGLEPVRFEYDSHGRLLRTKQGTGAEERLHSFGYDAAGNLVTVTDPLGRTTTLSYDLAGRVLAQTRPDGELVSFEYDANGNLTGLTPPGRPKHGFSFDPLDQLAAYAPPAVTGSGATNTSYEYDADQAITKIVRPDGDEVQYVYDSAGRVSSVTIPAGTYTYTYDPESGKLASMTAPGGVVLSYDYEDSLLTQVTWSGPVSGTVGYAYDEDFRIREITVNGTDPVAYEYDDDGLLIQAGDMTLTRDPQHGLLLGTTIGNVTDEYAYNGVGETIAYRASFLGGEILSFEYTRDKLGRITHRVETVEGQTTTFDYAYDAIGQLVEVRENDVVTASYTYDANGNRLLKSGPGISEVGTYDDQDRMLTYADATYGYAASGELQMKEEAGATTTFEYDAFGNLRAVTLADATQIEYLVDGQNRRVGKRVDGTIVAKLLYQSQLHPAAELDAVGLPASRFVYALGDNSPDVIKNAGAVYRILKDHTGSPRLAVDANSGAITQRQSYDHFGKSTFVHPTPIHPFGFAGALADDRVALLRFGARDYDPGTGTWTTKDAKPLGSSDSNRYRYAYADPINKVDHDGREAAALEGIRAGVAGALRTAAAATIAYQRTLHVKASQARELLQRAVSRARAKLDRVTNPFGSCVNIDPHVGPGATLCQAGYLDWLKQGHDLVGLGFELNQGINARRLGISRVSAITTGVEYSCSDQQPSRSDVEP